MNLPGFAADAAQLKPCISFVSHSASIMLGPDAPVFLVQIRLPPILCPFDHEPVLVNMGGQLVCT